MTQRSRIPGAAVLLLLLTILLSSCGATPVAQNWPGLTVSETTVYVISGTPQQVYLLNVETGVQQGSFSPQGNHRGILYWSPVATGNDLAFVGFSDSQAKVHGLYAFDPQTQQERWHVSTRDMILASPVLADDTLYFGVSDGKLYAVEAATGSIKPGWPFQTQEPIWGAPLVAEGRVYVPSMDHYLYCLNAETGQEVWKFKAGGALAAQPILADGILYFGAFDGKVYAVQADSGTAVSGFDFQAGNWIWSEVLLADGQLWVTSLDGKLYSLDPASGQVKAPYPYDAGSPLRAAPVAAGDLILVATESGQVTAVQRATGQVRWQWPAEMPKAGILTTPQVIGNRVYIILMDGTVYALEADSRLQVWSFAAPTSD